MVLVFGQEFDVNAVLSATQDPDLAAIYWKCRNPRPTPDIHP
jgi:hypothetical protein